MGVYLKPSELKPWFKHFPADVRDKEMPYRTLYDSIQKVCRKFAELKAIYYYGTSVTYAELLEIVDRLSDAYYGIGVREGDMVSFLMPTTPESIYSMYALNKIGAIPNFIDPRMDSERILDAVEGVKSKLFVSIDFAYPKVLEIRDKLNIDKIVISSAKTSLTLPKRIAFSLKANIPPVKYSETVLSWKELLVYGNGSSAVKVPYREKSVAAITYTGGTTGTPKGVMLTNDGLNTMADSFVLSGVDKEKGERFLEIMPIFASYGVGCGIHMPLLQGVELVVVPKFAPSELGGLIKKYKPNHMMAVPAFYEQIMQSKDLQDVNLSFLKTTGCGGDTMSQGLEERFNAFLKEHGALYPLSQGYGMSEMSGAVTCCFSAIYKDNSSGIPLIATTVGIFNPETGEELGFNQQGEICMTGRNIMLGYYNNKEDTDYIMRMHDDGEIWIHSGDVGYMDEDGFIFVKGRIKQIIIKFDGHKVFPVSVEAILDRHKAVGECAVVGIQDPDHAQGEVPLGIIELKSTAKDVDKEHLRKELLDMCDELCEERGRPADVVFIDEMLYTGLHKHDYRRLTDLYQNHVIQTH